MRFAILTIAITLIIIAISKPDYVDCPHGSTVAAGIGACK